jgi:hypothetical protein
MRRVDPLDRDHHHAAPCGNVVSSNRNAFRRVAIDRAFTLPSSRAASVYRKRSATHAPFSPWDGAAVRVSARAVFPRPAPRRRFALRFPERRDARCVGPTSAVSILRTSTRASSAPGWVARYSHAPVRGIAWFTPVRFASVGRTYAPCRSIDRAGRCLPSRGPCDFPHLWHPCRLLRDSRDARAPLDSSKVAETALPRPRETRCAAERSEVSSVVQGPSPRDALSGARLRTLPVQRLGHRCSGSRRLFTCPSSPGMSGRARPPFTRTVANG